MYLLLIKFLLFHTLIFTSSSIASNYALKRDTSNIDLLEEGIDLMCCAGCYGLGIPKCVYQRAQSVSYCCKIPDTICLCQVNNTRSTVGRLFRDT